MASPAATAVVAKQQQAAARGDPPAPPEARANGKAKSLSSSQNARPSAPTGAGESEDCKHRIPAPTAPTSANAPATPDDDDKQQRPPSALADFELGPTLVRDLIDTTTYMPASTTKEHRMLTLKVTPYIIYRAPAPLAASGS